MEPVKATDRGWMSKLLDEIEKESADWSDSLRYQLSSADEGVPKCEPPSEQNQDEEQED